MTRQKDGLIKVFFGFLLHGWRKVSLLLISAKGAIGAVALDGVEVMGCVGVDFGGGEPKFFGCTGKVGTNGRKIGG